MKMNLQKTKVMVTMFILAALNAGCSTNRTEETVVDSDIVEPSIVEIVESTDGASNDFVIYTNANHSFSIEYPVDWDVNEGESFEAFNVFISDDDSNSFGILPNGEMDFGLPWTEPRIEEKTISGKAATITEWKLENSKVLILVEFIEFPSSWNDQNRIQFSGTDTDTFEKMLQSFAFIN